jgi:hypothetical protein
MTDRSDIQIRLLGLEDGAAVARLAELDTAAAPAGPLLGGIVDGRLMAAHSVSTGASIADPFQPTAELRALLAERASQLRGGRGFGLIGRLRRRFRSNLAARPGAATEALR